MTAPAPAGAPIYGLVGVLPPGPPPAGAPGGVPLAAAAAAGAPGAAPAPAGAPGAAAARPPLAPVAPYVFEAGDITNPYAMTWTAYSTKLKPFLDGTYQAAAPARAARAPAPAAPGAAAPGAAPAAAAAPPGAPAAAPAPVGRGLTISSIKRALQAGTSPLKTAPNDWSGKRIKRLVDDAARVVPDLPGVAFDQNAFAIAILRELNNLDLQNSHRDRAPPLIANINITRANIGI